MLFLNNVFAKVQRNLQILIMSGFFYAVINHSRLGFKVHFRNHIASEITSRCILYYVGMHLLLHQDVSDATSGRNSQFDGNWFL